MRGKHKRILLIQETDWLMRGPHYHHHLFSRLNPKEFDIRIIDFPLIWDKDKRNLFPKIQGFKNLKIISKINQKMNYKLYRTAYINLPILNIFSIIFQRIIINRVIKYFNPHLVICFASLLNVNYINRLCKKNNNVFCFCIFEKYYKLVPYKFLQTISKILMEKALHNSDFNIALTKYYKLYLDKFCSDKNKNFYIPQGVDLKKFDDKIESNDKKNKFNFSKNETILFFMGWIYKFSGMKELTFKIKKSNKKDIKLLIVGEGGIYSYLKNYVIKNKLQNNIKFTGWVPYEEIPAYISISDICLLPAHKNEVMSDIVPIKLYEYLAMGKPVIATKLPGVMKEFGYDSGVIYIDQPEQILNKVDNILKNYNKLSNKARKFAENFDWNIIINKFKYFINEIIKQ